MVHFNTKLMNHIQPPLVLRSLPFGVWYDQIYKINTPLKTYIAPLENSRILDCE